MESNQPFGFFRPALIRLSYPTEGMCFVLRSLYFDFDLRPTATHQSSKYKVQSTFLEAPLSLGVHLLHHGTIIVHIHEQVLAPLGSCFGVVTKHDAFELHAQRRLRS